MALDRPAAQLTFVEARRLEARMCGAKARLSRRSAMASGRRLRAQGVDMSAYPCPFCGGTWWHLGHPPAMAHIELLARYLRSGSEKLSHVDGGVGA
jgi:hypothetical protein